MAKEKPELYFSLDVEADGPIPGPHSMLSFGLVAFDEQGPGVLEGGEFSANLKLLPDAGPMHPSTEGFWAANMSAYWKSREDQRDPKDALLSMEGWVGNLCGKTGRRPVLVSAPATFDHMWLFWYCHRFVGRCVFGFAGLDLKSMAMGLLRTDRFHGSSKRTYPRHWMAKLPPHTHVALEDAREQALIAHRALVDLRDGVSFV